jgi:hypothetical protein
MRHPLRKKDEIIRADHFLFSRDFYQSPPFQDEEALLCVRMGVRVRLTSIFNLPQDHFDATRTARPRTQEAVVCRFGMARRDIGRKVFQMGDILHFELLVEP